MLEKYHQVKVVASPKPHNRVRLYVCNPAAVLNFGGKSINTTKKNTEASNKVSVEVNLDRPEY
jgi:hypothetical protein